MKLSPVGLALIKRFESLKLKAYYCPAGVLTIGYGHTGAGVTLPGQVITEERADELLLGDVRAAERAVNGVLATLTQSQFDALVSFAFNVGANAFAKSTLRKRLDEGRYAEAAAEFAKWVHAGGKYLPGLAVRRDAEKALFLTA